MIQPPTAVVFDCDGVLVDSEPHSVAAWLDVLGRFAHPATAADIAGCVGLGFAPTHAALDAVSALPVPEVVWPQLLAALARSFEQGLHVFGDAIVVLDAVIRSGIPVAVASASPRPRLDLTLQAAGLAARFPVSIAGDEVAVGKPDPAVYLKAMSDLGVVAVGSVAIEDTAAGATSATRAGMRVIGVVRDEASREPLRRSGAAVVDLLVPALLGL